MARVTFGTRARRRQNAKWLGFGLLLATTALILAPRTATAAPLPYGAPIVVNGRLTSTRTEQGLIDLERSLETLFATLQRDLATSEQELTRRLGRLSQLQGQEAPLLEDLARRLSPPAPPVAAAPAPSPVLPPDSSNSADSPDSDGLPAVQQGFIFALASAAILALFDVVLKLILKGEPPEILLGAVAIPGVITPSLGNALLILLLRNSRS